MEGKGGGPRDLEKRMTSKVMRTTKIRTLGAMENLGTILTTRGARRILTMKPVRMNPKRTTWKT
jgi:hypothetical protein